MTRFALFAGAVDTTATTTTVASTQTTSTPSTATSTTTSKYSSVADATTFRATPSANFGARLRSRFGEFRVRTEIIVLFSECEKFPLFFGKIHA